ncbi:MAG: hypothetical protein KTR33_13290 [Gammaproteobacteria bacterium]|nr:hypothetical protein [Gammaproteobacteria bacterium]
MKAADNRWLMSIVVGLLVAASLFSTLDTLGDRYVDGAFKRALIGFAVARGLNGVISVAQGTEFAVAPAGVGVSFTPGEILDPINDLVERFSWIMLLSSSAIGVQKVLMSMSAWQGLSIALAVVGVALIILQWVQHASLNWQNVLTRLFLLLLVLRFMMPVISLANEWVYRTFLQDQYESASVQLEEAQYRIGEINDEIITTEQDKEDKGVLERARELYRSAMKQIDFEKRLEDYKAAAESISENTIRLIVVFLMQTVVFPLLFLWLVYVLVRKILL